MASRWNGGHTEYHNSHRRGTRATRRNTRSGPHTSGTSYERSSSLTPSGSYESDRSTSRGRARERGQYGRGRRSSRDCRSRSSRGRVRIWGRTHGGDNEKQQIKYTSDEINVFQSILDEPYSGMVSLGQLAEWLAEAEEKDVDLEAARKWVKGNDHRFRFATDNPQLPEMSMIAVYSRILKLCFKQPGGCNKSDCKYLNMCPDFVSGNCKLRNMCNFSHNVFDSHNKLVLEKVGLSDFKKKEIMTILQSSIPMVCSHHNSTSGCRSGSLCPDFHLCERNSSLKCVQPDDKCSLSHNLESGHNKFLLKSFNMENLPRDTQLKMMCVRGNPLQLCENQNSNRNSFNREENVHDVQELMEGPKPRIQRQGKEKLENSNNTMSVNPQEHSETSLGNNIDVKTILPALLDAPYSGKCTLKEMINTVFHMKNIQLTEVEAKSWIEKNGRYLRLLETQAHPSESIIIVKIQGLRLCFNYCTSKGCPKGNSCGYFHLCRDHIAGHCQRSVKNECNYPHDCLDLHNDAILKRWDIQMSGIQVILALKCSTPKVCSGYNSPAGCLMEGACTDVHICKAFMNKTCNAPTECKLDHSLTGVHNDKIMSLFEMEKLPEQTQRKMIIIDKGDRNKKFKRKANFPQTSDGKAMGKAAISPVTLDHSMQSNTEICEYFVRSGGNCRHGDQCRFYHYHLPYAWQVRNQTVSGGKWTLLPDDMQVNIEEWYCIPGVNKTEIDGYEYDFVNMNRTRNVSSIQYEEHSCVRRLSTPSYCDRKMLKTENTFATVWLWYWEESEFSMAAYGEDGNGPHQDVLEAKFQSKLDSCFFEKGDYSYEIDFTNMYQMNIETQRPRQICRRPIFVSPDDVRKKQFPNIPRRMYNPFELKEHECKHWGPMDTSSQLGFDLVRLEHHTDEYTSTECKFLSTLSSVNIVNIYRVQNLTEWKDYNRRKDRIFQELGMDTEKELFHGSDSVEAIKSICFQNFDHRCHGKNATVFGKGAYFAKDAKYSHAYTEIQPDGKRYMFLAKVVVGRYTKGDSSMQRPPVCNLHLKYYLYDSCVNDSRNPNIFVIFAKDQCYPAYLIEYEDDKASSRMAGSKPLPAPRSVGSNAAFAPQLKQTYHVSAVSKQASAPLISQPILPACTMYGSHPNIQESLQQPKSAGLTLIQGQQQQQQEQQQQKQITGTTTCSQSSTLGTIPSPTIGPQDILINNRANFTSNNASTSLHTYSQAAGPVHTRVKDTTTVKLQIESTSSLPDNGDNVVNTPTTGHSSENKIIGSHSGVQPAAFEQANLYSAGNSNKMISFTATNVAYSMSHRSPPVRNTRTPSPKLKGHLETTTVHPLMQSDSWDSLQDIDLLLSSRVHSTSPDAEGSANVSKEPKQKSVKKGAIPKQKKKCIVM